MTGDDLEIIDVLELHNINAKNGQDGAAMKISFRDPDQLDSEIHEGSFRKRGEVIPGCGYKRMRR